MRVIKTAEERRSEILYTANQLFIEKGYDNTSISDILNKIGIAKGTLYYYFQSKEDIMNAIIDKVSITIFNHANEIAENTNLSVEEKILSIIRSINIENSQCGKEVIKHINKPENTVMHQRQIKSIVSGITPILTKIINEGIEKGLFNTKYPTENVEMILIYSLNAFDIDNISSIEELSKKNSAFIYNLECIFNAKKEVSIFYFSYLIREVLILIKQK